MSKKLAIILVNWNSYALTDDTLQSLYKTSYKEYDINTNDIILLITCFIKRL